MGSGLSETQSTALRYTVAVGWQGKQGQGKAQVGGKHVQPASPPAEPLC